MGTDLVNWEPRIGGSGDDAYNIPGATKLDHEFDTEGEPTKIYAGNSSGANPGSLADFSSPSTMSLVPTIAQINASAGLNQVIGLTNRRIKMWYALTGVTSATPLNYITVGSGVTANGSTPTSFWEIYEAITGIRSSEGFTPYTFPSTDASADGNVYAGCRVYGYHVATMRKALGLYGVQTLPITYRAQYYRNDNTTWGSPNNEFFTVNSYFGKETLNHFRLLDYYSIPDYAASGLFASATLTFGFGSAQSTGTIGAPYYAELFLGTVQGGSAYPPSLSPSYGGTAYAYNPAAPLFSTPLSGLPTSETFTEFTYSIENSVVAAQAGTKLFMLFVMSAEGGTAAQQDSDPTMYEQCWEGEAVGEYSLTTLQLNWD